MWPCHSIRSSLGGGGGGESSLISLPVSTAKGDETIEWQNQITQDSRGARETLGVMTGDERMPSTSANVLFADSQMKTETLAKTAAFLSERPPYG